MFNLGTCFALLLLSSTKQWHKKLVQYGTNLEVARIKQYLHGTVTVRFFISQMRTVPKRNLEYNGEIIVNVDPCCLYQGQFEDPVASSEEVTISDKTWNKEVIHLIISLLLHRTLRQLKNWEK